MLWSFEAATTNLLSGVNAASSTHALGRNTWRAEPIAVASSIRSTTFSWSERLIG